MGDVDLNPGGLGIVTPKPGSVNDGSANTSTNNKAHAANSQFTTNPGAILDPTFAKPATDSRLDLSPSFSSAATLVDPPQQPQALDEVPAAEKSPNKSPNKSPRFDEPDGDRTPTWREDIEPATEEDIFEDDEFSSVSDAFETRTTDSTSATSSVFRQDVENGRRYQHFKNGRYPIPNDDDELNREDMKHAMMLELTDGRLFYAPIRDNPSMILDIGTGTGECSSLNAILSRRRADNTFLWFRHLGYGHGRPLP